MSDIDTCRVCSKPGSILWHSHHTSPDDRHEFEPAVVHTRNEEACIALESGAAAIEEIMRWRDEWKKRCEEETNAWSDATKRAQDEFARAERYRAAIEDAVPMLGLFRPYQVTPEQIENVRTILARAVTEQGENRREQER